MDAYQIIEYIRTSPKKTPVRVWLQTSQPVAFPAAQQFSGGNGFSVVFGDWEDIRPVLEENREKILSQQVENDARNSAIPLLDKRISMPGLNRELLSASRYKSATMQ